MPSNKSAERELEQDDEIEEETLDIEDTADEGDSPEPVDETARLEAAVIEAQGNLAEIQTRLGTAAATNNLADMLAAAEAIVAANKTVSRAQAALDAATFEQKANERMAFSVSLKESVEAFLTDINTREMARLGLRTITVTVSPENPENPLVNIIAADKPKPVSSTRTPGVRTSTSGKSKWTYNGGSYSSAELLANFGGEAGATAIDRARNYKDYGLTFSPGFDAAVKKLAKEIGATRE